MCFGFNKKFFFLDDVVDLKSFFFFILYDCGSFGIYFFYMCKGIFYCLYVYFFINVLKFLFICFFVIDKIDCCFKN